MELSVIIVNYKTPELTVKAIESILIHHNKPIEIIVVDNDSNDHSEALVKKKFPLVNYIKNENNTAFGRSSNIGAPQSKRQNILFL